MKIPRLTWWLALLAFVAVLIVLFLRMDNQPSYNGRSLESWLRDFGPKPIGNGLSHSHFSAGSRNPKTNSPAEAIQAIGTNAIPYLLHALKRKDDPPWMVSISQFLAKHKLAKFSPLDSQSRREQAALGLFALGTNALLTLPELSLLLTNYQTACPATHAMAGMGPAAIPVYQNAVANSNTWVAICGIWGLAQNRAASRSTVTNVLPWLNAANSADVFITTWALGEIREPSEVVIPELMRMLSHADNGVRGAAIGALTKFGPIMTNRLSELKQSLEKETDSQTKQSLKKLIDDLEKKSQMDESVK
jgi:hypothetical protein